MQPFFYPPLSDLFRSLVFLNSRMKVLSQNLLVHQSFNQIKTGFFNNWRRLAF